MADRRTLEELKVLLSLSRAAEEKFFYETLKPQMGSLFMPSDATLAVDESIRKRFPRPERDPSKGVLGTGSTNDYLNAYPEAAAEYKAAEAKEYAAEKKAAKLTAEPEKADKRNPFLRHRRRLVAQQLRQFKESPEGSVRGVGRQAGKFELLRLLQERPRHTKNPIQELAENFFNVAQEEARAFEEAFYGGGDDLYGYPEAIEKEQARQARMTPAQREAEIREHKEWATKKATEYGEERRTKLEEDFFKNKSQITPQKLRRMTDKDLNALLATGFRDPRITVLLLEEKRLRIADEYHRNISRRKAMGKIGKAAKNPTSLLTAKAPTAGSGGEKAARTVLRLLTRGR